MSPIHATHADDTADLRAAKAATILAMERVREAKRWKPDPHPVPTTPAPANAAVRAGRPPAPAARPAPKSKPAPKPAPRSVPRQRQEQATPRGNLVEVPSGGAVLSAAELAAVDHLLGWYEKHPTHSTRGTF